MSKDEQQKRGGFVPVGNLTLDLPGARLSARRKARHFTQLDQVTQLVAAREADPEMGFMARLLALCSLPRTITLPDQSASSRNWTSGLHGGANGERPAESGSESRSERG